MRPAIIEWVGPLCIPFVPKKRSMSGIMERTRISGMLSFVFRIFSCGLLIR